MMVWDPLVSAITPVYTARCLTHYNWPEIPATITLVYTGLFHTHYDVMDSLSPNIGLYRTVYPPSLSHNTCCVQTNITLIGEHE